VTGDAPLVSVVIVTFNGLDHLQRCLPSLAAAGGPAIEVIVVDNGSSDETLAWLAATYPTTRVVALGHNLGFGAANLRGVERATGRYVALLNNDTVVQPGWLEPLVHTLETDATIAAVCSTLLMLDDPALLNARGGAMTHLGYGFDRDFLQPVEPAPTDPELPEIQDVLFPTAAATLMRREEFLATGGFDPAYFMYHEDVDLGWRLWLTGRRVVVHRDSVVQHAFGGTSHCAHGLAWRERLGMRHNLRTLLKHCRARQLFTVLARIGKVWWRHRAIGQAAHALGWNLIHLPGTLARRRALQRQLKVDYLELFARGLIEPAGFPPPSLERPRARRSEDGEAWIAGTTLLPGEDSGQERLGWGWHARSRSGGRWLRWTGGHGRCFLKSSPGAAGTLRLRVMLPSAEGGPVTVTCNGSSASFQVRGERWEEIALPVSADAAGFFDIRISSPRQVLHELLQNWDFRTVGCAVSEVRFVPEAGAAPPPLPRVSVVLPTFNRAADLLRTLDALVEQTWPPDEVIVVDDGSTDGTGERLAGWSTSHQHRFELTALRQANAGPGQARNFGLGHARGDLVLFLGDDIQPEADLIAEHVGVHRRLGEPCAVVGFTEWDRERMAVTPFLEHVNSQGAQFGYGLFTDGADVPFTALYTSNLSVTRSALGDAPFDPVFRRAAWEDVELGYRLSLRGLRIVYHAAARARHFHPMAMADFLRRQRIAGEEVEVVYALHPELASSDVMPAATAPRWLWLGGWAIAAVTPLLAALDRLRVPLPARCYSGALLVAYFHNRSRTRRDGGKAR
jgi:GT2 family glycosyltransferase